MLELSNKQREYFGLDLVQPTWEKVPFEGDFYRPDGFLYYDGEVIRKYVISTDKEYKETQLNEITQGRKLLLPKTKKGKPKKLTASTLESRTPIGVYLTINYHSGLILGNHTTQTTFYSSKWEKRKIEGGISDMVKNFIESSPENHLEEVERFRSGKREKIKYSTGDFFTFKINRTEYGFGRILLDVNKLRKKKLIPENHGLNLLMGPPLLTKIYAYKSASKEIDFHFLKSQKALPSDYIMDNVVFYGEFEIIGNVELEISEFDFPMSYGRRIDGQPKSFFQWGLIHKEKPLSDYDRYITAISEKLSKDDPSRNISNPYGYYSIGFRPTFDTVDINEAIENSGNFDFNKGAHYRLDYDLRNPKNREIREELMEVFGLNPAKGYAENCRIAKASDVVELIGKLKN